MNLRGLVESEYSKQMDGFVSSSLFQSLESGRASAPDYDLFIRGVCRSHLKSPHVLAFLFALAPPRSAYNIKQNMLEELGLNGPEASHPSLLLKLMEAAGFDDERRERISREAAEELRNIIAAPLLYGTLKELGFSVLLETVAFEYMLSRTASRMARFLFDYRRLHKRALEWFYHHSEVDRRHAEEGLDAVASYADFYEIEMEDAQTILELTFRENVFIKRYFGATDFEEFEGALA